MAVISSRGSNAVTPWRGATTPTATTSTEPIPNPAPVTPEPAQATPASATPASETPEAAAPATTKPTWGPAGQPGVSVSDVVLQGSSASYLSRGKVILVKEAGD